MAKFQQCWREIEKDRPNAIQLQVQQYRRAFTPWGENVSTRVPLTEQLEIFAAQIASIEAAASTFELQRVLIIPNVNEFLMRDNPTPGKFELVLDDFRRWSRRIVNHLDGNADKYMAQVEAVISAARERFAALEKQARPS